jgi:hypothetical protein
MSQLRKHLSSRTVLGDRVATSQEEELMNWLWFVSYFFGGACLTNSIPHLVSGVTGRAFPTLFSKPIGIGLSSSTVNFLWGWSNGVLGYLLIVRVGAFNLRSLPDVLSLSAGSLFIGMMLARHFGTLYRLNYPEA